MKLKRPAAMFVIAALALGILSALATPASALTTEESRFVSLHNNTRASRGLSKLSSQSDLVTVARRHSGRMASKGTIWHNPNLANEVGGNWTVLGENVGMGPDVDSLFDAFMNSTGHRANILDRDYNQFGVGVVIKDGTIYVTVVFARRSSSTSTTVTKTSTTTQRTSTTTSRPRSTTTTRKAATAAAPKPAAPKPAPVAAPRTVNVLVQLVGMDASAVNPATGAALGV